MSKYDKSKYLPYLVDGKTPRCQATKTKDNQGNPIEPRQCRAPAVSGFPVCNKHGAGNHANPGGARPNPETRYSSLLPKRLAPRFEAILNDPAILEYRPDIALLMVRTEELLGRLENNAIAIDALQDSIALLERGLKAGMEGVQDVMSAVKGLKQAANAESENRLIWVEVRQLLQERRGLVSAEHARMMDAQMMMSMDEVFAMLAQVRRAILEHVESIETRITLSQVFERLADLPHGQAALPN